MFFRPRSLIDLVEITGVGQERIIWYSFASAAKNISANKGSANVCHPCAAGQLSNSRADTCGA
eukprot:scaffold119615_cov44-Prasinocladus_malaysianus.AAC.1